MKSLRRFLCLLTVLGLLPAMMFAQGATGSILKGVVTDPSGAAIPGASVSLTGPNNFVKVSTADENGSFTLNGLPSGKYIVRVSSAGFALFEQANFNIETGKQMSINVLLNIAAEKQQITVTDTVSIDLDPAANVGALTLKGEDLQMLSDNPDDLSAELQALAGPSAGPNGGQIFIDGFSGGKLPPKASIREIRINSNPFSSEYDRIGFGRIEIFTKPGSDKFRGQLFYNAGNGALNARNPFATQRPTNSQNSISGNLSGPLGKKASFFVDADSRLIDDISVINARVLDDAYNIVPLQTTVGVATRRYDITPRIDLQLSQKHTLTTRYSFGYNTTENGGLGTFTLPSRATNSNGHDNQVQATHTWLASGTIINEDRFQFFGRRSNSNGNSVNPSINVLDAFNGGDATISNNFSDEKRYEYSNLTSWTKRAHLIKFGGRIRGVQQNDQSTTGYNGSYTFANLNSFGITQRGLANGLSIAQIIAQGGGAQQFTLNAGQPLVGVDQVDAGLFIQDDWRVKPNFSLSLGLRFETQSNVNNKLNFAPRIGIAWGIGKPSGAARAPKTVLRAGAGIFYDRFSEDQVLQTRRLNGVVQQQFVVTNPAFYPNFPTPAQLSQFQRSNTTRLIDSNLNIPYVFQTSLGIERALPKNITLGVTYNHTTGINQLRSRNINTPLIGTWSLANQANAVFPYGASAGNLYLYESTGRFQQNQLLVNVNARINTRISMFGFYVLGKATGNTDGAFSFPNNTYDTAAELGRNSFDIRHRTFFGGSIRGPLKLSVNPFVSASTGGPFNIVTGRDNYGDNQFNHRPAITSNPNAPGVRSYNGVLLDPNPAPGATVIPRNFGQAPGAFNINMRLSRSWGFGGEPKGAPQDPLGGFATRGGGGGDRGGGGGRGGGPPMMMGGGGGGRGGGPGMMFADGGNKKYNITLSAQASNLLNRVNLGAPVGTLTSPLFGQSNTLGGRFGGPGGGGPGGGGGGGAAANRTIQLSLRFSF